MKSLGETPKTDSRATSQVSQRTQSRSVASKKMSPREQALNRDAESLRKAKASLDPNRLKTPLIKLQKDILG